MAGEENQSDKYMIYDERLQLRKDIHKLPEELLGTLVEMVLARESGIKESDDVEIEIDFESLKTSTLRALEKFMKFQSCSLYGMCVQVLQNNIDRIEDFHGVPFMLLRPVLEKCSAKRLLHLEHHNPQFLKGSECLWEKICEQHNFKGSERNENETWRELHQEQHQSVKQFEPDQCITVCKDYQQTIKTCHWYTELKVPRGVEETAEMDYMFSPEGIRERFPTLMMAQDTAGSKVDANKTNGRGHKGSSP